MILRKIHKNTLSETLCGISVLSVLLVFCVLCAAFSTAPAVFAQEFAPHVGTLFGYADELAAVPSGIFVESGGAVYVDAERFFGLFGYKSKVYKESKMVLVWNYNHKLLYMDGRDVFREVGSIFIKDAVSDLGEDKPLQSAAVFEEGRIYVPLFDALKTMDLRYENENYGVIYLPNKELLDSLSGYHTTKSEVLNFARILYYETRDASLYKKVAVAGVIMNRVNSQRFPNTVNDVIFARNQFPPVHYSGFSTLEPAKLHFEGAVRAINGENNAPDCFFFNNAPFYGKEADFYMLIEGDYFYR